MSEFTNEMWDSIKNRIQKLKNKVNEPLEKSKIDFEFNRLKRQSEIYKLLAPIKQDYFYANKEEKKEIERLVFIALGYKIF